MSVTIVKCQTCGNDTIGNCFDYELKVHKLGKMKQCSKCNNVSYPKMFEWTYWFCSRKCLMKFLEKHEKEDFKYEWEK